MTRKTIHGLEYNWTSCLLKHANVPLSMGNVQYSAFHIFPSRISNVFCCFIFYPLSAGTFDVKSRPPRSGQFTATGEGYSNASQRSRALKIEPSFVASPEAEGWKDQEHLMSRPAWTVEEYMYVIYPCVFQVDSTSLLIEAQPAHKWWKYSTHCSTFAKHLQMDFNLPLPFANVESCLVMQAPF